MRFIPFHIDSTIYCYIYIYMCIPGADISTSRYVYYYTFGYSSSPHFQLKFTGYILSSLQTTTTTAHQSLDVCRHSPFFFVVYSSTFSTCFCNPSGVSDIPTKSSANINPDAVSSPTVTPCLSCCVDCHYQIVNIYLK